MSATNTTRLKDVLLLAVITAILSFGALAGSLSALARGYVTDDTNLKVGMVAALSAASGDTTKVERASTDNSKLIVGVVTTLDNSLVTVASKNAKVIVENEGEVEVYASDIQGVPKKGDLVIISPLKGLVMKAIDGGTGTVVGIAASDFDTTKTETLSVQGGNKTKEAKVAKIRVNLNRQGAVNGNIVPENDSSIARLGQAVTGREIGEIRVIVALVIFFTVLLAEGAILYGAISSAIAAVGRNPLARKVIRQEFFKVVMIAGMVLILGVAAIYGILWI